MASLECRQHGDNPPYWRVVWYQGGRKQHERFDVEADALWFKGAVERPGGDAWPVGWIPKVGFADDAERTVRFRDFADKTISARLRADEQTRRQYKAMLDKHIYPVVGDLPLTRVDRFEVAKVAQTMIESGRASKTVANVHGLLSSILADAVADGLIPRNPAKGQLANLPSVKAEEMVALTPAEFRLIAAEIPAGVYRDLAVFLVGTQLRWSEATALGVGAVDLLDKRALTVVRSWKRRGGLFELGEPKTRRSRRRIDLSPALVDLLVPHVASKQASEFVFTTDNGQPIRHSNYYNRIWRPSVLRARQCKAHRDPKGAPCDPVKCPGVLDKQPRLHDLRHSGITWLINSGVSPVNVQHRAGHESGQTTIERYSHPSDATSQINGLVDRFLAESLTR